MKTQTFLIRCEYPDGDHIPTQEFVENIQEYFAANIMDGDYDRIKVKEVTDFFSLVRKMIEAQKELNTCSITDYAFVQHCAAELEDEVDEYLKKMEDLK